MTRGGVKKSYFIVFEQQEVRHKRLSQTRIQRCKTVLKTRVEKRLTSDVIPCLDLKVLAQNRTGPVSKPGTESRHQAIVSYRNQKTLFLHSPYFCAFFSLRVKNLPSNFSFPLTQKYILQKNLSHWDKPFIWIVAEIYLCHPLHLDCKHIETNRFF